MTTPQRPDATEELARVQALHEALQDALAQIEQQIAALTARVAALEGRTATDTAREWSDYLHALDNGKPVE